MRPAEIQLDKLQVGELTHTGRGKSASITLNKKPIRLTLTNCTTPFEVSSYDKTADRKSLDIRASDELQKFCKSLDAILLKHAATLTCTEGGYTSLLKEQKEGYAPLFRTKITITSTGKSGCKFFDEKKRRLSDAEIAELPWRDLEMNILCRLSSIWVNAGRWGVSATPEAIVLRRNDALPEELAFDMEGDDSD